MTTYQLERKANDATRIVGFATANTLQQATRRLYRARKPPLHPAQGVSYRVAVKPANQATNQCLT